MTADVVTAAVSPPRAAASVWLAGYRAARTRFPPRPAEEDWPVTRELREAFTRAAAGLSADPVLPEPCGSPLADAVAGPARGVAVAGGGGGHGRVAAVAGGAVPRLPPELPLVTAGRWLPPSMREHSAKHFTFADLEENEADLADLQKRLASVRARDVLGAAGRQPAEQLIKGCEQALESYAHHVYSLDQM